MIPAGDEPLAARFFRISACPFLLRCGGIRHQIRVDNGGEGINGNFVPLRAGVGIRGAVAWNLTHMHTVGPQVRAVHGPGGTRFRHGTCQAALWCSVLLGCRDERLGGSLLHPCL